MFDYPAGRLSVSRNSTVSVPPDRELGTVSLPGNVPIRGGFPDGIDRAHRRQARLSCVQSMRRCAPSEGQREAFVFVHGFNTNFAEGLYRQAQMRHDFGAPGISIHYAWPSAARAASYATDREAVLQARDELEQLIGILSRARGDPHRGHGHSMGAMLVMEALRQMAIRDRRRVLHKISTVVLMAPDIDVGVFRRPAAAVSRQDVSIYVFTSSRDRAWRLSAALRGSEAKAGFS